MRRCWSHIRLNKAWRFPQGTPCEQPDGHYENFSRQRPVCSKVAERGPPIRPAGSCCRNPKIADKTRNPATRGTIDSFLQIVPHAANTSIVLAVKTRICGSYRVTPAVPDAVVLGSLGAGNSLIHCRLMLVAQLPGAVAGSISVTNTCASPPR